MCTAVTMNMGDTYFGRTLDYEISHGERVTFTPRNFPLKFRSGKTFPNHYAILGMACVEEGYPLYFDAFNETGLAMAGLNFVGYARYDSSPKGKDAVASFEFIPWILCQCGSVEEARVLLDRIRLTEEAFRETMPPARLHWMVSDSKESLVVESTASGLKVYPNPVGVLTNNPEFDDQVFQLNNFMHLSTKDPKNTFSSQLNLNRYSRGMGALGLPGDLSSQSRFVRAAFTKLNSRCPKGEGESVNQFFHVMEVVSQTDGCCQVEGGQFEKTLYTSCCNTTKGIYYYTTYFNRQISGIALRRENLDGKELKEYPLMDSPQLHILNG